jgi:phosphate transport system permease protein
MSKSIDLSPNDSQHHLAYLRKIITRNEAKDQLFAVLGLLAVLLAMFALLGLIFDLFKDAIPRLNPEFFLSFPSRNPAEAGVLSAWVGSALVMIVTAGVSIPLGVAAGVYLEEYAKKNWISDIIEINVTNLAGVPSIIYGLLGLGLFKYTLRLGETVITAGLTLSLLALPVIIVTTREGLRAIPNTVREAAYAVGATKWQTIWDHVLPYSTGAILTGTIVALARAIGETAPLITIGALTFIAFLPDPPFQSQFPFISCQWLFSDFTVLPIQMFDWVSRPQAGFQVNAAAAGLTILVMTLVMNGIAIYLRYRLRKAVKW